ncbi:MAG: DUF362 domain-containing protein [Candidatus Omnitrophota bacterium]
MKSRVCIKRCVSYDPLAVGNAVTEALDALGGINNFVRPASKVLVKPNLLMAKEPEFGIDTHPEVVRAVIRVLKKAGCSIFVGDSPSVFGDQIENVAEVYARSGIKKICQEEEVTLVEFNKRRLRRGIPLTTMLDECEYLVSLPKFKTHNLTLLTGAIKNLFGLVVGTYKTEIHKNYFRVNDFSKVLVDIYEEAKPSLTIVDGIMAMEGDGPATAGKLRDTNLLLASCDCVALDVVMALIMGINPLDVLTTKEAAERGLGEADSDSIEVIGERLSDVVGEPFLLPVTSLKSRLLPKPLMNLALKMIRYRPYCLYGSCIRCRACIKACPNKCITLRNNRIVFDYSECISCFCCQEVCPASAIRVKKSLLAKVIGL